MKKGHIVVMFIVVTAIILFFVIPFITIVYDPQPCGKITIYESLGYYFLKFGFWASGGSIC